MKEWMGLKSRPALHLCQMVLGIGLLFTGATANAQTTVKAGGELASASGVSLNGRSASAGQTLFNNNRIKTSKQGKATINLGKLGRLELGPETELTLKFSPGAIGGALSEGRVLLSSSKGVSVAIETPKGLVTSQGNGATVLTIEMVPSVSRVATHLGEVNVASAGKNERIVAGEEVALAKQQQHMMWQHHKLLGTGAALAGTGGLIAASQGGATLAPVSAVNTPSISAPFTALLNAGVNYSLTDLIYGKASRDPEIFFSTTITCRDNTSPFCKRRSITTP